MTFVSKQQQLQVPRSNRGNKSHKNNHSICASSGRVINVLAVTAIVCALLNTAVTHVKIHDSHHENNNHHHAVSVISTTLLQSKEKQQPHLHGSQNGRDTFRAQAEEEEDTYLDRKYDVCIVGAGLSGSVLAERYASELKASVLVLEKRFHIGGNCYDYIDQETGIRVSLYGAHLFHTQHKQVESYVKNFGRWIPYTHKVRGMVNGKNVPIPVNIETVNTLFDLNIQDATQMDEWLKQEQVPLSNGQVEAENSEQVALSRVGKRLYDLIFRPYTYKQWAKYPVELGPEVLSRIPVRNDHDERYFSDPFQALPANGYTSIFHQMLSSPLIHVRTNVDYFDVKDRMQCNKLYFSGPIDAYFADQGLPKLEYRSLDFERVVEKNKDQLQSHFVVNHPQDNVDFTRIVEYKHLPYYTDNPNSDNTGKLPKSKHTIYFKERSKDNGEPYYPVPNEKNKALYAKYQSMAQKEPGVTFVGRLANYKYFNMDEAIKNALELFEKDTGIPYKSGSEKDGPIAKGSINNAQTYSGQAAAPGSSLVSFAGTLPTSSYSNVPPVEYTPELRDQLARALALPVDKPVGLRHEAHPPGHNAIMGLAAYPRNMATFRLLVGSLRQNGYDGHIILGVHKDIPPAEEEYLKAMDVTYYITAFVDCDASIMDAGEGGGNIRGKCSEGLEKLKLEWGRFEMCRQWLKACKECTGWTLVMDTRDVFFQADPFASLPDPATNPQHDLLLIEEIAPHSNPRPDQPYRADILGQSRYVGRTEQCYGKEHFLKYFNRPVLCSGTIIGTRQGMHRFLSVLVDEFLQNNQKPNVRCRSPHTTDQWTMNYLYYNGRFGEYSRTKTLPYGTGPIHTIGTPCINRVLPAKDRHSQKDLILFENGNTSSNGTYQGLILNIHEPPDSEARIAPAIHQFDRCHHWINEFQKQRPELSQKDSTGKYIPVDQLQLPYEKKTTS
uniref:UDP-galactopyranose mutase C-terminal domain-containing protein n=1 Tax=Amphora coffeiformis TaxID=265554 RepID=A0A7S3L505_9STRA